MRHRMVDQRAGVGVGELGRRYVDAKRQRRPRPNPVLPDPHLAAGGMGDPVAQIGDQAAFLRDGDEGCRRDQPPLRVVPANQRFEPGQPPVRQRHDGLVEQNELVPLDRAPHVALQPQHQQRFRPHFRREGKAAAAALRLGLMQRRAGMAQQIVRRFRSRPLP